MEECLICMLPKKLIQLSCSHSICEGCKKNIMKKECPFCKIRFAGKSQDNIQALEQLNEDFINYLFNYQTDSDSELSISSYESDEIPIRQRRIRRRRQARQRRIINNHQHQQEEEINFSLPELSSFRNRRHQNNISSQPQRQQNNTPSQNINIPSQPQRQQNNNRLPSLSQSEPPQTYYIISNQRNIRNNHLNHHRR
jgi:hypothetical protein